MPNLNKVILIGNLTRDPEIRYTPKGTAVLEITLAINRYIPGGENSSGREETNFIDVTLWNRQAEVVNQYLKKGQPLYIEGRLQLDSWEDKATKKKRTKLRVIAESMEFVSDGSGQRNQSDSSQKKPDGTGNTAYTDTFDSGSENIPF